MTVGKAFLGLGSNIDPERNISAAMAALRDAFEAVTFSPIYRSRAVGFEGDDFLNLVAALETGMPPLELDAWLHDLENAHGRDRTVPRWSSRTLDIDILLYGDLWLISPELEIPRKEILTTAHVLKPLADIAPDLVHPVERTPIAKLWSRFPKNDTPLIPASL